MGYSGYYFRGGGIISGVGIDLEHQRCGECGLCTAPHCTALHSALYTLSRPLHSGRNTRWEEHPLDSPLCLRSTPCCLLYSTLHSTPTPPTLHTGKTHRTTLQSTLQNTTLYKTHAKLCRRKRKTQTQTETETRGVWRRSPAPCLQHTI